jgi:hypothetical protein
MASPMADAAMTFRENMAFPPEDIEKGGDNRSSLKATPHLPEVPVFLLRF